ncbi:iron complex outermembrane recepter protein [Cyclobacterium xiamenense]|uniref:Iron complex outermembrane recepter protein n=1 Tax=Cyclobacterium xiamenense TaxID=1297121 RepID=A0A1H6Y0L7_9BACT|nr:TonB-dependent receptor [Cyclobacterium xiamenense]SEJ32567.1 iron complex outermembrane recepter protein [Cyclobacterium xiamenense]
MNYLITLGIFLLPLVPAAWAQTHALSGTLRDGDTSEALIGVTVFVPELGRGAISNAAGLYRIDGLPSRNLTIQFSYVGYATALKKVNAANQSTLDVQLESATASVDEVVVSAGYIMSRERSPISIEKINKQSLLRNPYPSLMTGLAKTPGVSEVSLGPGISKPVIRGLSFSRVLSVYQGARFENQQWGADHGLGLTETGLSGVEIIKGPASIIYGSGAMAGVVNLIEAPDAAAGEVTGDVQARVYSNSLGRRMEAGIKGASEDGFLWSLRGASESHADYQDGSGATIGNTRFQTQGIKAGVGLRKNWGDTRIRYTYLKQKLGILDENNQEALVTTRNDRALQLPFQDVSDHFLNSETNVFLGEDKLKATFGYHWNFREETEDDFARVDLGLRQRNFMYDIKYYKSLGPKIEAIVGVQGFLLRTVNYVDAAEILIPDAVKDDRSLYALLNYSDPHWVVQGGLRYDYRKVTADASAPNFLNYGFELPGSPADRKLSRSFDGITGSAGATFRPTESWRFRLNVASGFRAPDLAELYSNGPHPGTARFEQGSADFVREQNIQSDFGIRYQVADFSVSAEVFYNRVNNYIYFAPSDERRGDLTVWKFEQDNAGLYGGEVMLAIHPSALPGLSGTTSYSLVIGKRRSDQTYLPYIPAFRWNQDLGFTFGDYGSFKQPYVNVTGSLVLDQNRPAPLEESTPGYYILGLHAGISLNLWQQELDVSLAANNILDTYFLDHMSLYRPFGVAQTGRNISLNLQFRF